MAIPTETITMEVPTCTITTKGSGKGKLVKINTEQGKRYLYRVDYINGVSYWQGYGGGVGLHIGGQTIWIRTEFKEKVLTSMEKILGFK